MRQDGSGDTWRRVVGSPQPQRVVETRLIRLLLLSGAVVVCAGGGGVPVIRDEHGKLRGIEAVVDKDLTAAVLAEALEADVLLVLTDVPCVERGFGTPEATPDPADHAGRPPPRAVPGGLDGPQGRRRVPVRRAHRETWRRSDGWRTPSRSSRVRPGRS